MCQELKVWMHAVSVHLRLRCLANVSVVSVRWRCVCKCIIKSYRLYITLWVYVLVGVSLRGLQCCSQFFVKWLPVEAVLVVIVDEAHVGATEETVEQVLCSYDFVMHHVFVHRPYPFRQVGVSNLCRSSG